MKLIKKNEIIGYKVPKSLYYGTYKKDTIIWKTYFGYNLQENILPSEIIESWEPVFAKHDTYIYALRLRQEGGEKEIHYIYIDPTGIKLINGNYLNTEVFKKISETIFPGNNDLQSTDNFHCVEVCVSHPVLLGTAGNSYYLNIFDAKKVYKFFINL